MPNLSVWGKAKMQSARFSKKPLKDLKEFGDPFVKRLINVAQDLYQEFKITSKTTLLRKYSNGSAPTNELKLLEETAVLHFEEQKYSPQSFVKNDNADSELEINLLFPLELRKLINYLKRRYKNSNSVPLDSTKDSSRVKIEDKSRYKYEIRLTRENQVIINDFFLSQLRSKDNIETLKCCIKNPGQKIDRAKIEKEAKCSVGREFHSIISNFGFKPDVRKAFFPEIKKDYIIFNNPVSLSSPLKFQK